MKRNNEEYEDIDIEVIDEDLDPDRAAQYQYELVPNMWIGRRKVLEGIPSTDSVKAVLELALAAEPDPVLKNSRYEDELTEDREADTTAADTTLPDDLP